jgi:5-methylthioadenosine/S-adenosylhomocysteine deaminase
MRPRYDRLSQIAYTATAGEVRDVMVYGKMLMRNRRALTLDEENEIYAHIDRNAAEIQRAVGK